MIKTDYHMHTTFCDGKNSPEEMVQSAIDMGMEEMGFSVHGITFHDNSYCMKREKKPLYIEEINTLKEKYRNKIKIYLGVEGDYYSSEDVSMYDYVIGSVHYVKIEDEYVVVDSNAECMKKASDKYFGGDTLSFAEKYYEVVADVVNKLDCDIIGHFNLLEKFQEKTPIFDTESERYKKAWKKAVDALIPSGVPFEINTGAISRGYRTVPYPSFEMIEYIKEKGGSVIFSSDSHAKDTIMYEFSKWEDKVRATGVNIKEKLR